MWMCEMDPDFGTMCLARPIRESAVFGRIDAAAHLL
jgi:hypothetical protein